MSKQADIVLTPFPFTDLSGKKVRPALVLAVSRDDITVCFISSIPSKKKLDNEVIVKESKNNGLKTKSIIKVVKIATLEKKIILGKLGILDKVDLDEVKIIIKKHFKI